MNGGSSRLRPQPKDSGPWCWQEKAVRRHIRKEAGDECALKRDALAVYDAITEKASDEESETVTATHVILSDRSGVSVAQIKRVLPFLREIGAIHYSEQKGMRKPGVYSLLAHGELTLAPPEPTIAQGPERSETATPEERIEKPIEERGEKNPPPLSLPFGLSEQESANVAQRFKIAVEDVSGLYVAFRLQKQPFIAKDFPNLRRYEVPGIFENWLKSKAGKERLKECANTSQHPGTRSSSDPSIADGPAGWREALEQLYPGNLINLEKRTWSSVPISKQDEVRGALRT